MVILSEAFGDGSNGGEPPMNLQEEENHHDHEEEDEEDHHDHEEEDEEDHHENVEEDEEDHHENVEEDEEDHIDHEEEEEEDHHDHEEEEVAENLAPHLPDLPDDLLVAIVAPLPRSDYPNISVLSKSHRRVISSEQLYATRSLLGLTEPVLYTLITFLPPSNDILPIWFILHRSNGSLRLSRVPSLPPMFPGSATVTIGHKMYVMGGCIGINQPVKTVIVIDCRFHKWEYLQSMQRERCYAAAGVIDGKIYVVGGRERRYEDWVEVLDVENGVWETVPGPFVPVGSPSGMFCTHVVLDNKIYILEAEYCLAYDPRRSRWEYWGIESQQRRNWHASSCVVDDLLYAFVPEMVLGTPIVVYDPRAVVWRPVKGLTYLPALYILESRMANFGGKLVILGYYQNRKQNVWCVEVALERREDGDIWGKLESISLVNSFRDSPFLLLSRTVTL